MPSNKNPDAAREYNRRYYAENKAKVADYNRTYKARPEYKQQRLETQRRYRAKNKDAINQRHREYSAIPKNREAKRLRSKRWHDANLDRHIELVRKHWRENKDKYNQQRLVEMRREKEELAGRPRPDSCEVCGGADGISFDHCHQLGHFRGWLCRGCNTALGCVRDDPDRLRKLIVYLERNKELSSPQLALAV